MKRCVIPFIFTALLIFVPTFLFGQNIQDKITILTPNDPVLASTRIDSLGVSSQTIAWGTKVGVYLENSDGTGKWLNSSNSPFKVENFSAHAFFLGDYWVSVRNPAVGQGLFRYDGKSWKVYTPERHYMLSSMVYSMLVDGQKRLWIGYSERGMDRFIGHHYKNPIMLFEGTKAKHGLLPTAINALADSGGYIWIGQDAGLIQFQQEETSEIPSELDQLKMKRWIYPDFPAKVVFALAPYKNKVIAGTERGLVIPDDQDNWKLLTMENGLAMMPVKQVAYDGNRIWIGSPGGIQVYENGKFSPVIKGLPMNSASCIGVQTLPDGNSKVFVGTMKGARLLFVKP